MGNIEVREFHYNETDYTATLNDGQIKILGNDGSEFIECEIKFDFLASDEDKVWILEAIACKYGLFVMSGVSFIDISYDDILFAQNLASKGLPNHIALRLAVLTAETLNREELFEAFRNLRKTLYVNQETGLTSLEKYFRLAKRFNQSIADYVINTKNETFEELNNYSDVLLGANVHYEAIPNISNFAPQSLEAFTLISSKISLNDRLTALAVTRMLADTENCDWRRASNILTALSKNSGLVEVMKSSSRNTEADLEATKRLQYNQVRSDIVSKLQWGVTIRHWEHIFAVMIEKYGALAIVEASSILERNEVDFRKHTGARVTLAHLIIVADYVSTTGDIESPLDWIMLFSGFVESDSPNHDDW